MGLEKSDLKPGSTIMGEAHLLEINHSTDNSKEQVIKPSRLEYMAKPFKICVGSGSASYISLAFSAPSGEPAGNA